MSENEKNDIVFVEEKDENLENIDEKDLEFVEKKVNKLEVGKSAIKFFVAAVFLVLFFINGFLMQSLGDVYTDKVPVVIQIILMIGCLFAVGIVANFFGGKSEKEVHIREDAKIKLKYKKKEN